MTKIRLLNLVKFIVNTPIDYNHRSGDKNDQKGPESQKDFGVKSHIQDFYHPPDEKVLKSGEFIQGDEFQFLVEPKRKKNLWIRASLWVGLNLFLIGIVLSLVGFLSPQQDIIIGRFGEYIVLDKWAAVYNGRLLICRLIGLLCLVCGSVITLCALLLLHYEREQRREYYVMRSKMKPQIVVEPPMVFKDSQDYWGMHCIPSTSTVKGVQPGFKRNFSSFRNYRTTDTD